MYYHYGKWKEVVLFSEVTNVLYLLSLWEVVVLFSEVSEVCTTSGHKQPYKCYTMTWLSWAALQRHVSKKYDKHCSML